MFKRRLASLAAVAALAATPSLAATTVQVEVFNVEEEFLVELVNGNGQVEVGTVLTGGAQTFDLAGLLTGGDNTLLFSLKDGDGVGWTYGWRVVIDGLEAGVETCGTQGVTGCAVSPFGGTVYTGSFDFQTTIPEPATWAVMIGGFALVGGALRKARRVTTLSRGA